MSFSSLKKACKGYSSSAGGMNKSDLAEYLGVSARSGMSRNDLQSLGQARITSMQSAHDNMMGLMSALDLSGMESQVDTYSLSVLAGGGGGGRGHKATDWSKVTTAGHLRSIPELQVLSSLLQTTGLMPVFETNEKYTIFAPVNGAFTPEIQAALLPADTPEKKQALIDILTMHVSAGEFLCKKKENNVQSISNDSLQVKSRYLPIEKKGKSLMIAGAKVEKTFVTSNGVIHVMSGILSQPDVVGVVASDSRFSTLLAAIKSVAPEGKENPIISALQSSGPFTVFAPTDAAFANLPEGVVARLLKAPELMTKVLLFHVIGASVAAGDLKQSQQVTSLEGADLTVTKDADGGVKVNGTSSVVIADVRVKNGIIHAIDNVLVPSGLGL